jgi:chromosome segregation ATPase
MGTVPEVASTIKKTLELASRCIQAETSDNYGFLSEQVEELEGQAREAFRSKMDIASLLPKLEKAKPLNVAELKTLELLIVGDAEYYLKYETELGNWKNQLQRVFAEIAKLQSSDLDVEGLMHVRALCREASEILPDIVFYLDAKERASKFQAATQGTIDPEGYRFLAEIVRQMMASS